MGIAQIALDPPPLSNSHRGTLFWTLFFHLFFDIDIDKMSLKVQKPSWQVLWPPLKQEIAHWDIVKKCSKPFGKTFTPPLP